MTANSALWFFIGAGNGFVFAAVLFAVEIARRQAAHAKAFRMASERAALHFQTQERIAYEVGRAAQLQKLTVARSFGLRALGCLATKIGEWAAVFTSRQSSRAGKLFCRARAQGRNTRNEPAFCRQAGGRPAKF